MGIFRPALTLHDGRRIEKSVYNRFNRMVKKLGTLKKGTTFYSVRRGKNQYLLENGASLDERAAFMRHSTEVNKKHYVKLGKKPKRIPGKAELKS